MSFIKRFSAAKAVFLAVLVVFATGILLVSCDNKDGGVTIPVPNDTSALAKINHFIPRATIDQYKRDFIVANDSQALKNPALHIPVSEAFNKPALLEILKDPNCVGIRVYYGVKKGQRRNEVRLILVGVDSQGKDLYILEGGEASKAATQGNNKEGGLEMGQCPTCDD